MNILEKYLRWAGVEKPEDLDSEEKKDFERWKLVMNTEELTLEQLVSFMKGQVEMIETHWKDLTIKNEDKAELIPYHTTYKTLLMAIHAPQSMREALETQLNQKINQHANTR